MRIPPRRVVPATLVAILAANLGALPAARAQDPQAPAYGRANPKKIEAFVVLLRLRQDIYLKWQATGQWPEDDKAANQALAGHGTYWDEQLKAGRALFAGAMGGNYWDNAAIIVVEAASLAEAEALANNDPAIKAYVFQAQVRPFDVFWLTNKYGRETPSED